jgi:lactoylglutathione lyase
MNVQQVTPLLIVSSMERSVRYFVDGLGFAIKHKWIVEGKLRWCWLALGGSAIMLQESVLLGKVGEGVSLYFICEDALAIYHEVRARGIQASEPEVGNSMWVTGLIDPDGYRLFFESLTDTPEETKLSEVSTSGGPVSS